MVYAVAVYGKGESLPVIDNYHLKFFSTVNGQRFIKYPYIDKMLLHPKSQVNSMVRLLFLFKFSGQKGIDSAKWVGAIAQFTNEPPMYVDLQGATVHTKLGAGYYFIGPNGKLTLMGKSNTDYYSSRLESIFKKLNLV